MEQSARLRLMTIKETHDPASLKRARVNIGGKKGCCLSEGEPSPKIKRIIGFREGIKYDGSR